MKLGRLLLRLTIGAFFIGHGTQKLFGWFGGHGLDGTGQFFEGLGLRPGRANALAAGAAEAGGGALIAAGLALPVGATAITATMLTAINRVHFKNGPWVTNGGYEYNAVLIAAVIALTEVGPGPVSLDAALGHEWHGPVWALAALTAGAAGAAAAHQYVARQPQPQPAPAEAAQAQAVTASEAAEAAV
jgi:putative oxidoreductase